MNKTKHKSFHEVDTNFGTKKKVEICLQSRCLFLLPYTVVTRGIKNMYPLSPLCLTLFCQMNRDLEKTCCSSITWPFSCTVTPGASISYVVFCILTQYSLSLFTIFSKYKNCTKTFETDNHDKIVFHWCQFCKLHRQNPHAPPPF